MLILATLLTNCSSVKKLSIFKQEVPRVPLNLEKPAAPNMEKLNWIIITSDNAEEVFAKMKEDGKDPVLFGLSDDDYEILAKNFAQIRNQLKITNDLLDKYKKYYETDVNNKNTNK